MLRDMPVPHLTGEEIMAIDEGVGLDGHHVSDGGLGREATTLHLRAHVLDHRADPALSDRNPACGRPGRCRLWVGASGRVPALVGRLPPLCLL